MMTLIPSLLVLWLLSGCGLAMVGEPVQELDLSSQDDAEENLKAVRAILSDEAGRKADDEPSRPPADPAAGDTPLTLLPSSPRPGAMPSPSSSTGQPNVPARLPWSPTASDPPAVAERSVPAYTVPAPVGPDYSGAVRCTPDGMGGQRCLGR
jgi:hypothetical protein